MKWTSVACAYLMVIAAFYVMTADVSADEVALPDTNVDEIVSNIEHNDRRITISNSMASSPAVAVGADGDTHIAWVDGEIGSQSVSWKRSNDSMSTFTSDEAITTSYYSISSISILLGSAFGTAIAFEGKLTSDASPSVYFLYSEDDDDWSNAYAVSVGSSPSLTTDGDAVYIAMNIITEETTRYSLAAFRLIDGSINATLLAALPVSASDGDIAFFDGLLNVAMVEESTDALYFMQLTDNGTVVTDPTLVSRTGGGSSVDLMSVNGNERILFVENDSIMLACCLGAASNWISHTVLEINGTISEASLAASGSSLRIAYTVVTDGCSIVYVAECDLQGNAGDTKQISTSGLDAVSPAVFSITSGSFSCIYAEEHSGTQELFMRQDIEYVVPDITRLPSFISSIDHRMFRHGNESASELRERVNVILAHRNSSQEALAVENATGLREDLSSYFVSTPYADLDEVEDVKTIIVSNLETVTSGSDSSVTTMSTGGPGGTISYMDGGFFRELEAVTNSTTFAEWYYQNGGDSPNVITANSGYLMWGSSSSNLTHRVNSTTTGPARYFQANITGLDVNTTYYVMGYVVTNTTTYSTYVRSFCTYPDTLTIFSINVTMRSTSSVSITWLTNCPASTYLEYGRTTSYGEDNFSWSYDFDHDSPVTEHMVNISNLAGNTPYHYRIISNYSYGDFSIYTDTGDRNFTVFVPVTISSVSSVLTSPTSVQITWTTNVNSNSTVYYGTTTSYGSNATGNNDTTLSVTIDGLTTNTLYHYKVRSVSTTCTNISANSSDYTFTTQELIISSVSSVLTDPNIIRITWTTNYYASTRIYLGTTTSYDHQYLSGGGIYHDVQINDLSINTLYHYKVESIASGMTKTSSDMTFTTDDLTIGAMSMTFTDATTAHITWTTDFSATTVVNYGTTTSYNMTVTGGNGLFHSVNITGLMECTTYHYKIRTVSTGDTDIFAESTDLSFTTGNIGDAGTGGDASNLITNAPLLIPGCYDGYLTAAIDTDDYYGVPMLSGQTLRLTAVVPSSFNYDLFLYAPSGYLVSSSTGSTGVDESIQYTTNSSGIWSIRLHHTSGTGQGSYSLSILLLGEVDRFSLDVGSTGDSYLISNLPGMNILNGTGWGAASGGNRQAAVNGSFLLNIYDGTYQSSTYYQISIAYNASADIGVQVLVGDSWVTVATMPGSTAANTYSFVLKSEWLSDSSGSLFACNVRFRFSHAVVVDSIDAVAVAYASDLFGSSQNYPGVMLENNWAVGNAVVNGSASATMLITLPRSDQTYLLELVGLDPYTGIGVQQYVTSAYASIGTLESWGTSAVVQLNPTYTDAQGTTPGSTVRIRLTSAIKNLTRVVLWTSRYYTDVGASGDTVNSSHTPGISLLDNGEWGNITSSGGVYWRSTVSGNNANFYLNGAESDAQYLISITYKVTSGTTSLKQFVNGTGNVTLGSLTTGTAWRTDTFVTSAVTYDSVAGGQIDILFEIASTTAVAVDSITVYRDSDGDTYSDAYEALRVTMSAIGTHTYDLNPFSADTDSDGLNDDVERTSSYLTDPTDADTDNDNLTDGSERYSYTWSTDESHLIPDNGTTLTITLQLPAVSGTISSLCLVIGMMHEARSQLRVQMSKGATGTTRLIKASGTGSGANYFALVDLFSISSPYSASDLASASTWKINVTDVTAGSDGRVEYVRLQVNGTTNVLDSDSDDDGLSDGEEVNFGNDGWYTNPRSSDSDSDGVSDGNEIAGTTLCGSATDPTRADTDDDGYNDSVDRYMGDAVLRVSILEYRTKEDINLDDDRTIFFVIKYNGEMLSTKRMAAHTDTLYSPGWTYDIDIAETVTSVSVIFYAVADDAGTIPGDDIKLDVSSTSNLEHTVTWALSTTQYQTSFEGTCGWLDNDADGYMKVGLQRCVAEKAKVIVINGTSDNGDYGLDAVSTGIYRYSADDQVYLINLNVSTANARFQQGMNTIILPRAIALQCQLNDTLYNLQSIGSTPLAGASFYSTDQDSASASSHVIAVITMNVTYQQAEDILEMLTHNSTGARIGNNVTVSSTSVYLMHLPNDVLSSIPTSVTNSGLGGAPNFFDPLDVISDIANLVFDFLIWIATGGVLLLWVHLVIMGLEIIANLITTAIAVVEEAVDAIVDAFLEFVDWMVEFIQNLLDSSFSSGSEERGRTIDSHLASIAASSNEVVEEYNATGTVTAETQARYQNSLGALIVYAMLIGVTLFFILIFVMGLTNVWGFLLGTIIGIMAGYLIQSMFDTAFEPSDETGSDGNLPDSAGVVMVAEAMGLAPDSDDHSAGAERWRTIETGIGGILDWHALLAGAIILVESKNPSVLCIKGFVISLISIAIGTSDYALDCPALGWISISLGLIGLGLSVVDFVKNYGLNVNKKMDIISMSIDSMALALAFDLIEYPEM